MTATEIGIACFLLGLGLGVSVSFAIAEWMARREQRAWENLRCKYEMTIEQIVDIAYEEGVTLEGLKKINEIKLPQKGGG